MDGKFWSQVIAAPHDSITLFSGVASRKATPRHTAIASVNGWSSDAGERREEPGNVPVPGDVPEASH